MVESTSFSVPLGIESDDVPTLAELNRYVVPKFSAVWEKFGIALGLDQHQLAIISKNHAYNPHRSEDCCREMLTKWLQINTSATWGVLEDAVHATMMSDDPASSVSCDTTEPPVVREVSKHLKSLYKHTRYTINENTWPPDQPKHFTNLAIIQCKDNQTTHEAITMTEALALGGTDRFFTGAKLSHKTSQKSIKLGKDIAEIFTPFDESDIDESPTTIVIEGGPGIGKTALSKEVALQWAKGVLLLEKVLVFLLFLIDPMVQNIDNISDLIHYFYQFDDSCSHISKSCAEYLIRSQGHNVMFVLDGYDELSERIRTRPSFIYNLIHRNVLPESTLVITSRPHVLGRLRYNADLCVIILGFTEEERRHYVQCSLKNQSEKISVLLEYLHSHSTISNLCYIPFNITVLVYLYKQDFALPKNSTELYNHFLCNIIYCHLAKHKIDCPENVVDLNTLPQPFNKTVKNLAAFALTTVLNDKLTFTWQEIKAACPKIDEVPGAIDGFGLIHAVETYSNLKKSVTLTFIHLSVQEYLAAYHIASLKQEDELKVLQTLFYLSKKALNVLQMYVGLTKGQRPALKELIEWDGLQCYLQFNCFSCFSFHRSLYEAGDMSSCNRINEFIPDNRIIHHLETMMWWQMQNQCSPIAFHQRYHAHSALLPSDVENLTHFLAHQAAGKLWKELHLDTSYIGDHGCQILHNGLIPHVVLTIEEIDLSNNSLTSPSANFIADIVIHCRTKRLRVMENRIGADAFDRLLCSSSMLKELNWDKNHLSSTEAIILFRAIRQCNCLKVLEISNNAIGDDAAEEMAAGLRENNTLRELWITGNPLTGQASLLIVQSLNENTVLEFLWLPACSSKEMVEKIEMERKKINDYRKSKQCLVHLKVYLTGVCNSERI